MLVPLERRDEESLEALRTRIAECEALLRQRAAEIETIEADLEAFRARYQAHVGRLHERLDELEYAIAEAELGELSRRLDEQQDDPRASSSAAAAPASRPRFTSDAVRKLFRDVAKLIHPDLADDEHARDHRHTLMVEATRAYVQGDEAQLRWILDAWESRSGAMSDGDVEAVRARLLRRATHLDEQLQRLNTTAAALKASPLWELKVMVDHAAVRGRDLVADMVRRLERDIMVATNRLDAMRPPS